MTKHFKIRCTTAFLVFTGFTALLMLSCGGCGSGKVQKLTSDLQKINDYSLQANDDTVKYLFMDDPILSKLKLTRIPKAEVITEYDEKGIGVAMHMFDENGKHLGVFDYKKWEEEDMLNELLQKYKGQDEFRVHISKENRTVIWNYLNQKNFQISEKEYNKMNYLSGNGLVVGPAIQWYSTENAYCSYGFIGIRKILLDKNYNNEDLPDIFLHQTYLFDYTGKLKKIYNYEEMGEKLMLFEGGKKGLSQYLNSPWDEIPVKYFRIHDFKENSFLDFDAYTICNNYFREQPSFLGRQYYLGMQENKVDMVFKGGDKQETYINIIVDTQEKKAYCKVYEIPFQNGHSEWQLFTKPDGSKIDLSEYEIIKF